MRRGRLRLGLFSFDVPAPQIATGPVSMHLERRPRLRLRVGKGRLYSARRDGRWWWEIVTPGGQRVDAGTAPGHAEALAVGLAALEAATVEQP